MEEEGRDQWEEWRGGEGNAVKFRIAVAHKI